MISIIICSRTGDISPFLKDNIKNTIGIDHETIVIDNSNNEHSIFSAYNLGVKQSKYPYLCFMHDDIAFHTTDWGAKVVQHFADDAIGAIGIGGSPYFPSMPGAWWSSMMRNEITATNNRDEIKALVHYFPGKSDKNECVVLDGIWMCIRRPLFEKIRFDDVQFNGYHFYDIDISLQIHDLGYKLYGVFDILIQHFSTGNMNKVWLKNALLIQKKWKRQLPASCIKLSYFQICKAELRTLNEYLDILLLNKISKKEIYKIVVKELIKSRRCCFYYQTPFYCYKFLTKILNYDKT